MSTKPCDGFTTLVVLFSLLSLSLVGTAAPKAKINITNILGKDPTLSTFSSLLNKTGLTHEINTRRTITILAVDNAAIGGLSAKSLDKIKYILSAHVILDYYDITKLRQMSFEKNATVTTLFQATGFATDKQGHLNIVALPNRGLGVINKIRFGSAMKDAPMDIQLVSNTEFAFHEFDYVVLRVSGVIFTPGIDGWTPPPTVAPKNSPVIAPHPNKNTTTLALSPDDDDYDMSTPPAAPPSEGPALSSPPVSSDAPDTGDADDGTNNNDAASIDSPKSSAMHFSSTFCLFTALVVALVSSFTIAPL